MKPLIHILMLFTLLGCGTSEKKIWEAYETGRRDGRTEAEAKAAKTPAPVCPAEAGPTTAEELLRSFEEDEGEELPPLKIAYGQWGDYCNAHSCPAGAQCIPDRSTLIGRCFCHKREGCR